MKEAMFNKLRKNLEYVLIFRKEYITEHWTVS